MKIALIQYQSVKGDIAANILRHLDFVKGAIQENADLVVFPELSLTGYEPSLANDLAIPKDDTRLQEFQQLADNHHITIGIGVPLSQPNGVSIAMLIIQPLQERKVYIKNYLHEDELPYFVTGNSTVACIKGKIGLAICYELSVEAHLKKALQQNITTYLASTAKHQRGVADAHRRLSSISRQHGIYTLFCNSVGESDNFTANGGTAAWDTSGTLIYHLNRTEERMSIVDVR